MCESSELIIPIINVINVKQENVMPEFIHKFIAITVFGQIGFINLAAIPAGKLFFSFLNHY